MRNVGRNPAMMKSVIITPDFVCRVTYHRSAYWTSEEPKMESVWLVRKSAVVRFHD
jgi:hypothetical protein